MLTCLEVTAGQRQLLAIRTAIHRVEYLENIVIRVTGHSLIDRHLNLCIRCIRTDNIVPIHIRGDGRCIRLLIGHIECIRERITLHTPNINGIHRHRMRTKAIIAGRCRHRRTVNRIEGLIRVRIIVNNDRLNIDHFRSRLCITVCINTCLLCRNRANNRRLATNRQLNFKLSTHCTKDINRTNRTGMRACLQSKDICSTDRLTIHDVCQLIQVLILITGNDIKTNINIGILGIRIHNVGLCEGSKISGQNRRRIINRMIRQRCCLTDSTPEVNRIRSNRMPAHTPITRNIGHRCTTVDRVVNQIIVPIGVNCHTVEINHKFGIRCIRIQHCCTVFCIRNHRCVRRIISQIQRNGLNRTLITPNVDSIHRHSICANAIITRRNCLRISTTINRIINLTGVRIRYSCIERHIHLRTLSVSIPTVGLVRRHSCSHTGPVISNIDTYRRSRSLIAIRVNSISCHNRIAGRNRCLPRIARSGLTIDFPMNRHSIAIRVNSMCGQIHLSRSLRCIRIQNCTGIQQVINVRCGRRTIAEIKLIFQSITPSIPRINRLDNQGMTPNRQIRACTSDIFTVNRIVDLIIITIKVSNSASEIDPQRLFTLIIHGCVTSIDNMNRTLNNRRCVIYLETKRSDLTLGTPRVNSIGFYIMHALAIIAINRRDFLTVQQPMQRIVIPIRVNCRSCKGRITSHIGHILIPRISTVNVVRNKRHFRCTICQLKQISCGITDHIWQQLMLCIHTYRMDTQLKPTIQTVGRLTIHRIAQLVLIRVILCCTEIKRHIRRNVIYIMLRDIMSTDGQHGRSRCNNQFSRCFTDLTPHVGHRQNNIIDTTRQCIEIINRCVIGCTYNLKQIFVILNGLCCYLVLTNQRNHRCLICQSQRACTLLGLCTKRINSINCYVITAQRIIPIQAGHTSAIHQIEQLNLVFIQIQFLTIQHPIHIKLNIPLCIYGIPIFKLIGHSIIYNRKCILRKIPAHNKRIITAGTLHAPFIDRINSQRMRTNLDRKRQCSSCQFNSFTRINLIINCIAITVGVRTTDTELHIHFTIGKTNLSVIRHRCNRCIVCNSNCHSTDVIQTAIRKQQRCRQCIIPNAVRNRHCATGRIQTRNSNLITNSIPQNILHTRNSQCSDIHRNIEIISNMSSHNSRTNTRTNRRRINCKCTLRGFTSGTPFINAINTERIVTIRIIPTGQFVIVNNFKLITVRVNTIDRNMHICAQLAVHNLGIIVIRRGRHNRLRRSLIFNMNQNLIQHRLNTRFRTNRCNRFQCIISNSLRDRSRTAGHGQIRNIQFNRITGCIIQLVIHPVCVQITSMCFNRKHITDMDCNLIGVAVDFQHRCINTDCKRINGVGAFSIPRVNRTNNGLICANRIIPTLILTFSETEFHRITIRVICGHRKFHISVQLTANVLHICNTYRCRNNRLIRSLIGDSEHIIRHSTLHTPLVNTTNLQSICAFIIIAADKRFHKVTIVIDHINSHIIIVWVNTGSLKLHIDFGIIRISCLKIIRNDFMSDRSNTRVIIRNLNRQLLHIKLDTILVDAHSMQRISAGASFDTHLAAIFVQIQIVKLDFISGSVIQPPNRNLIFQHIHIHMDVKQFTNVNRIGIRVNSRLSIQILHMIRILKDLTLSTPFIDSVNTNRVIALKIIRATRDIAITGDIIQRIVIPVGVTCFGVHFDPNLGAGNITCRIVRYSRNCRHRCHNRRRVSHRNSHRIGCNSLTACGNSRCQHSICSRGFIKRQTTSGLIKTAHIQSRRAVVHHQQILQLVISLNIGTQRKLNCIANMDRSLIY